MRKPIEGSDYCVRVINFPTCIGGAVVTSEDGFYNIYLNGRCSLEKQRESLVHELRHIVRNDFYNGEDITEVEKDRLKGC